MTPIHAIVLVVDDDSKVRASLEMALPDCKFLGALNGQEAVELLQKPNEIDLVVLDVKMQGVNGIDLLQKIKTLQPDMPVIILTGYGTRDILIGALQGHADDFQDKPFEPEELRGKIRRLVDLKYQDRTRPWGNQDSIERIMRFVRRNYERDLTLGQAAKVASLSPKYLSRKFKSKTSKSFTQFRIDLKMDQAKQLLANTALNVNQIADRIGYENPESFMKMFKKTAGCTPSQYREGASKK